MLTDNKDWMSLQTDDDRRRVTRDTNNSAIAELAMQPVGGQSVCEKQTCPMSKFNTLQVRAENRVMRDAVMDRTANAPTQWQNTGLQIDHTMFASNSTHSTKLSDMFAPLDSAARPVEIAQQSARQPVAINAGASVADTQVNPTVTRNRSESTTRPASAAARTKAMQHIRRNKLVKSKK